MRRTRSSTAKKIKKLIKEFRLLSEDGAGGIGGGNFVGTGAIAGAGVSSPDPKAPVNFAEPGVSMKKKKVPGSPPVKTPVMSNFRRSPPKM